ncbi:MAG: hypothetical protein ACJASR_002440 [Psychroserpens sp.]|jgi:hypothetical protein
MKILLNILLGSAILFSFSQCGNSKNISNQLETKTPFSIEKASYNDWVAGVKGGGSGTNVIVTIKDLDANNVVIDSMYFRGRKVKVEVKSSNYIGRFNSYLNQRQDKVLHSDSQKEFGNQVPIIEKEFPFDLENDEAIISYKEKRKLKFYKITLEKGEDRLYR